VVEARLVIAQLLEEAILSHPSQWDLPHLAKQYRIRLKRIPEDMRAAHAAAIEANFGAFHKNRTLITVGDGQWWMPFPFGWRLCGDGVLVKTILEPSETIATEMVKNPLLPEVHKSWWRDKH